MDMVEGKEKENRKRTRKRMLMLKETANGAAPVESSSNGSLYREDPRKEDRFCNIFSAFFRGIF